MRLKEIEKRLAAIRAEVENPEITEERLAALETEVTELQEERTKLLEAAERRAQLLTNLANGDPVADPQGNPTIARVVRTFEPNAQQETDMYDTREYRTAFMNYVCRNVEIPREYRTAETTTTAEAGAVIPTSYMNEIIRKLSAYGNLYAKFRKINVQGGVEIPISDLKPTAHWITEEKSSDDQKLTAKNSVSFKYNGLECKLAQSILSNVVSLDIFNDLFVQLAAEAMVEAIEKAAINGDGSGKPLGVTKDVRITRDLASTNVIEMTEEELADWGAWHKKVKAKMKKAYRKGCFIMNQGSFDGYIDGMTDKNGQPIGRTNYGINGEENYRFMGKEVETVDDILPGFAEAGNGEVVAVFMDLSNYVINTNMQMTTTKWVDHDNNKVKNKCLMVVDGKAADVNGILLIKKKIAA